MQFLSKPIIRKMIRWDQLRIKMAAYEMNFLPPFLSIQKIEVYDALIHTFWI